MSDNLLPIPTLEQIDDAIEEWHRSDDQSSLSDWLGWSSKEYSAWVADPTNIPNRPLKTR